MGDLDQRHTGLDRARSAILIICSSVIWWPFGCIPSRRHISCRRRHASAVRSRRRLTLRSFGEHLRGAQRGCGHDVEIAGVLRQVVAAARDFDEHADAAAVEHRARFSACSPARNAAPRAPSLGSKRVIAARSGSSSVKQWIVSRMISGGSAGLMMMIALPRSAPPTFSTPLAVVRVNSSIFWRVPGPTELRGDRGHDLRVLDRLHAADRGDHRDRRLPAAAHHVHVERAAPDVASPQVHGRNAVRTDRGRGQIDDHDAGSISGSAFFRCACAEVASKARRMPSATGAAGARRCPGP